jgi:penicillin-binding protein 1A
MQTKFNQIEPSMRKKAKEKTKITVFKWLIKGGMLSISAVTLFIFSVYFEIWTPLPNEAQLKEIRQSKASEVYAANGKLIGKFYIFDRQPIAYNQIPEYLINALIATEDARFYEHSGIDSRSLLRVAFKTVMMQNASSGGGSTITQQLAKNLFPRSNYGIFSMPVNKTKEMIISLRLEKIYTKKEILALYLNTVSFGDNTYGIESGSLKFFNKKTSELTLPEAALLIGMLKNSNFYNPRLHPERSKQRRNVVLSQMARYNYLTAEELDVSSSKNLKLNYRSFSHNSGIAPYFREQVKKELKGWIKVNNENAEPINLFTSGLKIYTTLDYNIQKYAEESMKEHMSRLQSDFEKSYQTNAPWEKGKSVFENTLIKHPKYVRLKAKGYSKNQIMDSLSIPTPMELFNWSGKKVVKASVIDSIQHYLKFLNTGMLSLDPRTGAVKAWVGGIDFEYFQFDHVSQSKRQVGSTFKPFVYTAALEAGLDPCEHYSAKKVTYTNYNNWTPTNSGGEGNYDLNYSMKGALSNSVNTVAVKVLEATGLENVIAQAHRMGIESELPEVPSIALGTAEISLLELATAYTGFVNKGKTAKPFFIAKIENSRGELLAEFNPKISPEPAYSESTREMMIEMMKATVNEGTASRLRWKYGLKNDVAGKTGTTQSNKDGWFVGITPKLLTVAWVGSDNHAIGFRSTSMGQGANSALPIFALMLKKMNSDAEFNYMTQAEFSPPSVAVLNKMGCAAVKENGLIKKLLTNTDKPKPMEFETVVPKAEKKEGLFSRIGNLFKKKH